MIAKWVLVFSSEFPVLGSWANHPRDALQLLDNRKQKALLVHYLVCQRSQSVFLASLRQEPSSLLSIMASPSTVLSFFSEQLI